MAEVLKDHVGVEPASTFSLAAEVVSATIDKDEIVVSLRITGSAERPEAIATAKGHVVMAHVPAKIVREDE